MLRSKRPPQRLLQSLAVDQRAALGAAAAADQDVGPQRRPVAGVFLDVVVAQQAIDQPRLALAGRLVQRTASARRPWGSGPARRETRGGTTRRRWPPAKGASLFASQLLRICSLMSATCGSRRRRRTFLAAPSRRCLGWPPAAVRPQTRRTASTSAHTATPRSAASGSDASGQRNESLRQCHTARIDRCVGADAASLRLDQLGGDLPCAEPRRQDCRRRCR